MEFLQSCLYYNKVSLYIYIFCRVEVWSRRSTHRYWINWILCHTRTFLLSAEDTFPKILTSPTQSLSWKIKFIHSGRAWKFNGTSKFIIFLHVKIGFPVLFSRTSTKWVHVECQFCLGNSYIYSHRNQVKCMQSNKCVIPF